jgi:O6-methylguanine-DNA--protein-cysteine methyltransferase
LIKSYEVICGRLFVRLNKEVKPDSKEVRKTVDELLKKEMVGMAFILDNKAIIKEVIQADEVIDYGSLMTHQALNKKNPRSKKSRAVSAQNISNKI